MPWETLPSWFWFTYYVLLLLTFICAIYSIYKKIIVELSVIAIFASIVLPLSHSMYSLGRDEGLNEFQHIFQGMTSGDFWAFYLTVLYLFLIFWWGKVLSNYFKNNRC